MTRLRTLQSELWCHYDASTRIMSHHNALYRRRRLLMAVTSQFDTFPIWVLPEKEFSFRLLFSTSNRSISIRIVRLSSGARNDRSVEWRVIALLIVRQQLRVALMHAANSPQAFKRKCTMTLRDRFDWQLAVELTRTEYIRKRSKVRSEWIQWGRFRN